MIFSEMGKIVDAFDAEIKQRVDDEIMAVMPKEPQKSTILVAVNRAEGFTADMFDILVFKMGLL
jgi:hypothetical protein